MPKAIIYCRVSSDRQVREGHGLEGQESRCRKYAQEKNYEVISVFRDEGVSGGTIERAGIDNMIDFLTQANSQSEWVVIIDDIKRLARDIVDHFTLKRNIESTGARIESPSHRFGSTPEDHFIESIMAASAELERNQNKRQVRHRMQARLEAGYWLFYPPPGYVYQNVTGHGKMMVPKGSEADLIREVFEGYANHRFETRGDIIDFLKSKGFKSAQKQAGSTIYSEHIRRVLSNELYTGFISYPQWNVTRRQAQHEPLVSWETFCRVQDRLRNQSKPIHHKNNSEDFPLRGFVLCTHCEKPFTAGWSKGRRKKYYGYYRCDNRDCSEYGRNTRWEKVHADFEALLSKYQPRRNLLKFFEEEFLIACKARKLDVQAAKAHRREKLTAIETEIKKYLDLLTQVQNSTVLKRLEQEIGDLEAQKLRIGGQIAVKEEFDFEVALKAVLTFIEIPLETWNRGSLAERRVLLRLFFTDTLRYCPKRGFEPPQLSQPVAISCVPELDRLEMVERIERTLNPLCEEIQRLFGLVKGHFG